MQTFDPEEEAKASNEYFEELYRDETKEAVHRRYSATDDEE